MLERSAGLHVEALGPLRVRRGPVALDLGPAKQRAVFAALVVHVGNTVTTESLQDLVWGTSQPLSSRQLVHTYVARLRRLLEPEKPPRDRSHVIAFAHGGYSLMLGPDMLDVTRFRQLFRQAKRHLAADEPERAFDLLGEAMLLWRDPRLAELSSLLTDVEAIDTLQQGWLEAAVCFVTVGLGLGAAAAVLPVAHQLAITEPLHEEVQARYLVVLQQTGQRAAAIGHYHEVRDALSDELGVAPGPQLTEAYMQVTQGISPRAVRRAPTAVPPSPARPPWRGPGPGVAPLVHREKDLDAVQQILGHDRLLTVAGPPGCGKSVLALQAASQLREEYPGGIAVLECSRIADLTELRDAVVRLLDGEAGVDDPVALLGDQELLLVLDDVDHLLDSCAAFVDELLRSCRHSSVVVTSREPLGLSYETTWRLATLTPDDGEPMWVGDRPAVRLFARRAAQVCPGFKVSADNAEAVAALCERLDDLPLAVELAAECLATDTLDEVVGRLEDPLHEFAPPRRGWPSYHRTLLTALRRSLDCLSDREQWCFVRLGGLPPRFRPAAAERAWAQAPCPPVDVRGMLAAFVDKSLLFVDHGAGGPCYHMQQLTHRFASELDAMEAATESA